MFHSLGRWYRDFEHEQLAVLETPELVQKMAPGFRRCWVARLAKLSAIERQQLHAFSMKYRGRVLLGALLKWVLSFSLLGLVFHLLRPVAAGVHVPILVANALGLVLLCATIGALFNYREILRTGLRRFGIYFGLSMGVALMGVAAGAVLNGRPVWDALQFAAFRGVVAGLATGFLLTVPIAIVSVLRNQQYQLLTDKLQGEAERARLAKELSESRLHLLRAQIEPHFLFNTLGAVQQLAEQGAPRAAELTANLIAFLRASLAEMRSEQVSLQAEFGLVEAYLQVMTVRLGERLQFSLDLPAALEAVEVPSMILLTLVENAIKHGIEPSLRGGAIAVTARLDAAVLSLAVHDSGVGLAAIPGKGLGLDNVRTRLHLAYGSAASLAVDDAEEGGVAAVITLPVQQKD